MSKVWWIGVVLYIFNIKVWRYWGIEALREDTHKKKVSFSGRTTKGVGTWPLTTKQKTTFFLKSGCFNPKIGQKMKKNSTFVSGYYKTKKKEKEKWFGSADCDTISTIYLSLCTQKADPNPFRGTNCCNVIALYII